METPIDNANSPQHETASIRADNTVVMNPVAPFKTVFAPNTAIAIDSKSRRDFRLNIMDAVRDGHVIYTVFGSATQDSLDSKPELIGEVVCDGEFASSTYGDEILFFRHPSLQWSS